jgi:hypothetical protein
MFSRRSIDVPCSYCSGKNRAIVGRTPVITIDRIVRVDKAHAGTIFFMVCTFCKSDVILYEETEGNKLP